MTDAIDPTPPKSKPASTQEEIDAIPDGSGDPEGEMGEDEHGPEDSNSKP
jgi:hypothetical protein